MKTLAWPVERKKNTQREVGLHDQGSTHISYLPLGHDSGIKPNKQCRTIEKHMKSVANEAETVGPDAVRKLDEHECCHGFPKLTNPSAKTASFHQNAPRLMQRKRKMRLESRLSRIMRSVLVISPTHSVCLACGRESKCQKWSFFPPKRANNSRTAALENEYNGRPSGA